MTVPALLLIAHGTRDPRGSEEMEELLALLRARHPGAVEAGWLEDFATPSVTDAVGALARAGATEAVCVPFLNFAAYHANTDIPRRLADAAAAHPQVSVRRGAVLAFHPALLELAAVRVRAVSTDPAGEVLIVGAPGSSNPEANSDVSRAARLLAEATGHRWVEVCFAGVTWPRAGEVIRRVAAAGAGGAVLFSWSLLAGRLEQRVTDEAAAAAESAGVRLRAAGRFGPHPLIADAVLDRWREAAT